MTRCFELRTYSVYSEPLQQCVLLAFFRDPRRPLKEKPQAHFISSRPPLESGLFFASVFWPQNRGHKKRSNTMWLHLFGPHFLSRKWPHFWAPPCFASPRVAHRASSSRSQGPIEWLDSKRSLGAVTLPTVLGAA